MVSVSDAPLTFDQFPIDPAGVSLQLPDPKNEGLSEPEFLNQVDTAWLVCDRFDLQTEIWRGRILRAVRDREKHVGEGRGSGFLNWLKDREISKTQAYSLIELANSADELLDGEELEPEAIACFSKRAFIETAQAAPEVQQLVTDAARRGERITRQNVRQLADEWTAVTSDLLSEDIKEKAASQTIPTRYLAPLVRELEKLPPAHQAVLQEELAENPDVDTLKQVTAEARYLAKYLTSASQVQALNRDILDLESALEEALRLGCLNSASELVHQSAQLEQMVAKLYTTWKRVNSLTDQLYVETGSSSPNLRSLLQSVGPLSGETIQIQLGDTKNQSGSYMIQLKISTVEV
jgi:hypothetical protein